MKWLRFVFHRWCESMHREAGIRLIGRAERRFERSDYHRVKADNLSSKTGERNDR